MSDSIDTILSGQTVRFEVPDLQDIDGTPITSAPTMEIVLYNQNSEVITQGTVLQYDPPNNNSYYADITFPEGILYVTRYIIKVKATLSGQVFELREDVWSSPY